MSLFDLEVRGEGLPGTLGLSVISSTGLDYSIFWDVVSFPCLMTECWKPS